MYPVDILPQELWHKIIIDLDAQSYKTVRLVNARLKEIVETISIQILQKHDFYFLTAEFFKDCGFAKFSSIACRISSALFKNPQVAYFEEICRLKDKEISYLEKNAPSLLLDLEDSLKSFDKQRHKPKYETKEKFLALLHLSSWEKYFENAQNELKCTLYTLMILYKSPFEIACKTLDISFIKKTLQLIQRPASLEIVSAVIHALHNFKQTNSEIERKENLLLDFLFQEFGFSIFSTVINKGGSILYDRGFQQGIGSYLLSRSSIDTYKKLASHFLKSIEKTSPENYQAYKLDFHSELLYNTIFDDAYAPSNQQEALKFICMQPSELIEFSMALKSEIIRLIGEYQIYIDKSYPQIPDNQSLIELFSSLAEDPEDDPVINFFKSLPQENFNPFDIFCEEPRAKRHRKD